MCKNAHTRIRAGSLSHARGAYGHAKGHSRSWHDVLIGVKAWLGLPVPERTAKVNTKQASDVSSDCGESEEDEEVTLQHMVMVASKRARMSMDTDVHDEEDAEQENEPEASQISYARTTRSPRKKVCSHD